MRRMIRIKKPGLQPIEWVIIGAIVLIVILLLSSCDDMDTMDMESGNWVLIGEATLINVELGWDGSSFRYWKLEFDNGIVVLLTGMYDKTKPWRIGTVYAVYYNPEKKKNFVEMR